MHNLGTTQENMISYSDLEQATTMPKQLWPIKSIEFAVEYAFDEFIPGE